MSVYIYYTSSGAGVLVALLSMALTYESDSAIQPLLIGISKVSLLGPAAANASCSPLFKGDVFNNAVYELRGSVNVIVVVVLSLRVGSVTVTPLLVTTSWWGWWW
jgi:hypothetical protein